METESPSGMFKLEQEISLVLNDGPPIFGKAAYVDGNLMIQIYKDDERNETAAQLYGMPAILGATLYVRP
jgi:hypothetical protein